MRIIIGASLAIVATSVYAQPSPVKICDPKLSTKCAYLTDTDGSTAVNVKIVGGAAGDGKLLDGTAAGQADVIGVAPTTEQGLVVRNIPSGTQAVSGTVTANAGTGTFTVGDGAGALNVIVDSGAVTASQATATNLRIAGGDAAGVPTAGTVLAVQGIAGGTTLPVSGTVTANAGTGTFTVGDGAGALNVIIDSGSTTVTQATATSLRIAGGDVAGTPTAGTVLAVQGVASGTAVPVSGTVTANAGTGTFTVGDGAGALNTIVDSGALTATQGTAAAGSGAWPVAITNTADTVVKPGDSVNNAVRVNVVAGGAGDGKILDGTAADQADVEAASLASAILEGVVTRPYMPGDGTLTATVRDTGTADSQNVAIVDAAGNQITSFGGGTQYDEDTPSAAADKITMAGVVRKDTAATLVDLDGDRTQLQVDAVGRLHVNGSGVTQPVSGTVTANAGTGTFTVGDGAGALNVIVDSGSTVVTQSTAASLKAEVVGTKSSNGGAPGAVNVGTLPAIATVAAPAAATEGNQVALSTDLLGNQRMNLMEVNDAAVLLGNGTAAGALRVSMASDSTGQVTLAAGSATIGALTANQSVNAAQWGGTAVVTGGVAGLVGIGGRAAHSGVWADNPLPLGAYVEADAAALDSSGVVDADVTRLKASAEGKLLVQTFSPNHIHCMPSATSAETTATTRTVLVGSAAGGSCAAPGAGLSIYVTSVVMSSSAAATTTADQLLQVQFGTGGACGTGTTDIAVCLNPANGGCALHFETPVKATANNEICFFDAVAGTKTFVVTGFIAP